MVIWRTENDYHKNKGIKKNMNFPSDIRQLENSLFQLSNPHEKFLFTSVVSLWLVSSCIKAVQPILKILTLAEYL